MDAVFVIVIMVFAVVGLAFFVGRQSQKHDMEMEKIQDEIELRKQACEIHESVTNTNIDAVRDELRDEGK